MHRALLLYCAYGTTLSIDLERSNISSSSLELTLVLGVLLATMMTHRTCLSGRTMDQSSLCWINSMIRCVIIVGRRTPNTNVISNDDELVSYHTHSIKEKHDFMEDSFNFKASYRPNAFTSTRNHWHNDEQLHQQISLGSHPGRFCLLDNTSWTSWLCCVHGSMHGNKLVNGYGCLCCALRTNSLGPNTLNFNSHRKRHRPYFWCFVFRSSCK